MSTKLVSLDQWLKSLDPHRSSRWLLMPSGIAVALLLPWILGDFFGVGFRTSLGAYSWPVSAPFAAFSFIGLGTIWRTQHRFVLKAAFFLWHALAVLLLVTPLLFFGWFTYQMRDH